MIFGLILKFFSGLLTKILQAIAYMVEHWKVFLPLLVAVVLLWYIHAIRSERDVAVSELKAYIQEAEAAAVKRKNENDAKELSASVQIGAITATHESKVNQLRKQYADLTHDKTLADRSIDNWRDSLRNQLSKASTGLPLISKTTEGTAEVGDDGSAAATGYACALTVTDYNALWDAWDKSCAIYGCK